MNERIEKLVNKAGHTTLPNFSNSIDPMFAEKFAELIVQECINICEDVAANADATANSDMVTDAGRMLHQGMYGGAKSCGGIIKHHFGVES